MRTPARFFRHAAVAAITAALVASSVPVAAFAEDTDLESLQNAAIAAGEQYDQAQQELDSLQQQIDDTIDLVAAQLRGAMIGKSFEMDIRDYYVPTSYSLAVLTVARAICWSRFPMSPAIAMDELRQKELEYYRDLIKDPTFGADKPEWEYSSKNPDNQENQEVNTGSIKLPFFERLDNDLIWNASLSAL